MSTKRWKYGVVSALSLLAVTVHADPPAHAPGKQGRNAAEPVVPAARATAHAEGEHGEHGEDGAQPVGAARARPEAADRAHDRDNEQRRPPSAGRPEDPPRAAIEALMRAQLLSEEQAIAHLRAQGVHGAGVAAVDAMRGHREDVRRDRAKQLRGRLRARGIPSQVRVELRTHAKRLAQIERIRTLVNADTKMTARVEAMLGRENERHTRRLTRLIDEANQAPAGAVVGEAAPGVVVPGATPGAEANPPGQPATQAQKATEQGVTP